MNTMGTPAMAAVASPSRPRNGKPTDTAMEPRSSDELTAAHSQRGWLSRTSCATRMHALERSPRGACTSTRTADVWLLQLLASACTVDLLEATTPSSGLRLAAAAMMPSAHRWMRPSQVCMMMTLSTWYVLRPLQAMKTSAVAVSAALLVSDMACTRSAVSPSWSTMATVARETASASGPATQYAIVCARWYSAGHCISSITSNAASCE
mmetsp:Transcript_31553/g.80854  ORF Transcript_31553/g.80854 Transcript_31553/m.80854 type:complete len:209 (+) Transcript_31553:413-1039(+)